MINNRKKIYLYIKAISIFLIFLICIFRNSHKNLKKKKKIGIISVRNEVNIGNNLVKYAISQTLKEFGFIPYIIATHWKNYNITFINQTTNLVIIKKNFSEIKQDEYDILMVNSDQTWKKFDNNFYDYGFLKFAEKWNIPKFSYAASYGDYWALNEEDKIIIKKLIKKFRGLSVRERTAVEMLQKIFGVSSIQVLDPTLLLDKKDYLALIKNYKSNINVNKKYVFSYIISPTKSKLNIVKNIALKLNYNVHFVILNNKTSIQNFIYLISNCKAVITNSYHGTIFSIIFNKPFITFANPKSKRIASLAEIFKVRSRIIKKYYIPDLSLLNKPLNLNMTLINLFKEKSLNFLKKNLQII
jgi:hypothetical protein